MAGADPLVGLHVDRGEPVTIGDGDVRVHAADLDVERVLVLDLEHRDHVHVDVAEGS